MFADAMPAKAIGIEDAWGRFIVEATSMGHQVKGQSQFSRPSVRKGGIAQLWKELDHALA